MSRQLVGSVIVPTFVLNSTDCNAYALYLIALDLLRICPEFAVPHDADTRYVEVSRLEVVVHDGPYVLLEYRVSRGRGFRLPRIVADCAQRDKN